LWPRKICATVAAVAAIITLAIISYFFSAFVASTRVFEVFLFSGKQIGARQWQWRRCRPLLARKNSFALALLHNTSLDCFTAA
jgi:hypothetical protein